MIVKMEALRTFAGAEGFFKKGQTFDVKDGKRALVLSEAGLAKMVADQEPYFYEEQPLPEDQKPMEEPIQDVPPPQGESWGVTSLGGGWYEIPSGEKFQGFEKAKESLFDYLSNEFQPFQSSETEEEVRLIKPIEEPQIIFTGEPEILPASSEEYPPTFEDDVRYLGGGWYELPNGERVQGKESARDVYEAYLNEGGNP